MLSSYEGRIVGPTRHNIKCFYSRIIFLFRMFLYGDVLEVVIQTVQLHKRAFLGLSTVRTEQSHARQGSSPPAKNLHSVY